MLSNPEQLFVFLSKKLRSLTGFVEKIILITLSLTLAFLFFINGGVDPGKHAFLVPLFGVLIFLHGIYVYLRDRSKRREGDYKLNTLPLKFLPFLIWVFISVNFISPVPWLAQMYLIYYFEAFIIFWIIVNHVKNLKQFGFIFIGLSLPFLVHLYLGLDQFFHGRSLGESGLKKTVSGLFFESNSYVFLISVVFAGILPALIFHYWEKAKRFIIFLLLLLLALSIVMSNNFQGFLMLAFSCMSCSYFAFYKNATRIKFLLTVLVFSCVAYLVFYYSSNLYADYFYSAFEMGDASYFFSAWIASLFLFFKNCLIGVGLGGFEAKLYSVKSINFPLAISNPCNFYLLLFAELGIIGAFLIAKPLLLLLKENLQELKSIPRSEIIDLRRIVPIRRFFLSIFMSASIAFLLIGLLNSVVIIPFFLCFFAILIAGLSFKISPQSLKIESGEYSLSQNLVVRKNSYDARYYLGFACLLAVLFSYDGYKVFKSQDIYENAFYDFQTILETSEDFRREGLFNTLHLVEGSIKENRYNLDAWLLKHEILNAIYNENSIRFNHYPELMLEASNFVLDRKQNYWLAWMRHGISLTLNGNLEEAENAFNRAIQLAPNNFKANFYMGSFLMNFEDRFFDAQKYIEKALVIAPANKEALALHQKLKL